MEFTPQQLITNLRVVDDVRQPNSQVSTSAKFVVQAGKSLIERAG